MIWYDMMLTTLLQWLLILSHDYDNEYDDDYSIEWVYEELDLFWFYLIWFGFTWLGWI